MNENRCYENYKNVLNRLGEYDPAMADLFYTVVRRAEKWCFDPDINRKNDIFDGVLREIDELMLAGGESINLIPSDQKGPCHESCLVVAKGQWNKGRSSFQKYAKEVIKIWLDCCRINKRTLICTAAWDAVSFEQTYKDEFDIYAKTHNLVIILLTDAGPSIVYMGK